MVSNVDVMLAFADTLTEYAYILDSDKAYRKDLALVAANYFNPDFKMPEFDGTLMEILTFFYGKLGISPANGEDSQINIIEDEVTAHGGLFYMQFLTNCYH